MEHARIADEPQTYEWQHLTSSDFARLDRSRCVVTVSCSPLEVHGPHLPVICDNLEADALIKETRIRLSERHPEIIFLRLPSVYVAADVLPHPGSLAFRASTAVRVLTDLGRTLTRQGLPRIWVSNFHGGPRHFLAIEQAAHRVNRRFGGQMISVFSLLAKRLTEGTSSVAHLFADVPGLGDGILEGDSHGGAVETSLLLHLVGAHVDPVYATLPRQTMDTEREKRGRAPVMAKPGRTSFRQRFASFVEMLRYYARFTYAGAPSRASAEAGREVLARLGKQSAEILSEVWTGKIPPSEAHSPVWPYRSIFLSETIERVSERLAGVVSPIW